MSTATPPKLFDRAVTRLHCLGVGGMGLGPLALYLAGCGFRVSGEDDAMTEVMRRHLERGGVVITPAGGVPADCDLVVHSSAIPSSHPGFAVAQARGIAFARRGEVLAEVARDQKLVAICGSHGKTTTAAMVATVVREAKFPAGYILGGLSQDDTFSPARVGTNGWLVAEIDESDGTIAAFAPEIAVVVNLDWDHPDHYRKLEDLEAAFVALAARTRGPVLINAACERSRRIAATVKPLAFGPDGEFAGHVVADGPRQMRLDLSGRFAIARAVVNAGGAFNASNATAALAAAQLMGATLAPDVLATYAGMRRRQAFLPAPGGLTVVEDYAHHPAEIRALLESLRPCVAAGGRLLAVFQPHRFSRTERFKADFASALALADQVWLLDVYGAGEAPLAGGTSADLHAEFARLPLSLPVEYAPDDAGDALAGLAAAARAGDLVAFIGAGDIDRRAREWLERMRARSAAAWDEQADWLSDRLSAATTVRREEPLAVKTTLRVGGAARLYAEPAGLDDLLALLRGARERGVPVHVLGRGSNLLVPDEGVDALVLSLRHPAWETFEPQPGGRIRVGAGLRLKNLCGLAVKAGLAGFEFLEGIPGNVGGALRMNAGAMGGWMFDVVEEVQVVTYGGEVKKLRREEMHVDYRHCAELHEAIAIGAVLKPAAVAAADAVARQIDVYRDTRQKSQPREPSAGCIFKNPPGDSAGRLIDACGLKGARVGDAEVSSVHANFIINRGRATSAEVIALVRRVRARVEADKGVNLEPEVLFYGRNWKDVL